MENDRAFASSWGLIRGSCVKESRKEDLGYLRGLPTSVFHGSMKGAPEEALMGSQLKRPNVPRVDP